MSAPDIAIIGGGPCGLTLARLLECKGIDYLVYERDESENSNRAGGSLDIHAETGQKALREGGLFEKFKTQARYNDTIFRVSDKLGNKVLEIGQGRDAPEIDRFELRKILLDSIPKDKIRWGHTLASATIGEDNRPVLRFGNDVVVSGMKLVVGADGAWSKVRPIITKATPQYSGKTFVESRTNQENPHYGTMAEKCGAGNSMAIGSGKVIVAQRQGNLSYRNYFGLQVPEDFTRNGGIDLQQIDATRQTLLLEYFPDWSDEYKEVIQHATDLRAWPLYTLSTDDMGWKSVPGFTLAGDAAHLAITNGEGVNLAMTDSMELASKIAEHGFDKLEQAVLEYEADMFTRGIASITQGKVMADVMYREDPGPFLELIKLYEAAAE